MGKKFFLNCVIPVLNVEHSTFLCEDLARVQSEKIAPFFFLLQELRVSIVKLYFHNFILRTLSVLQLNMLRELRKCKTYFKNHTLLTYFLGKQIQQGSV